MSDSESSGLPCGLVLAGGRALRLGGVEKGLVDWQGRPLANVACQALRSCCDQVVISANRAMDDYRKLADAVVTDEARFAGAGPLAGLLAGLEEAATQGYAGVLVMPCDTPLVDAPILKQLLVHALAHEGLPSVARVDGRLQPLHGFYPVTAIQPLRDFLASGERKVGLFLGQQSAACLDLDVPADRFRNLNRDTDWPT